MLRARRVALVVPLGLAATRLHPEVAFQTVFQPIVRFSTDSTIGYEAFSRFEDGVSPDQWLANETIRGFGVQFETALARAAVESAVTIPTDAWLALNASVDFTRATETLARLVREARRPLVLEIDGRVADQKFLSGLGALPEGVSISVTGVLPEHDSLSVVAVFQPAYVKLDRSWVTGIDSTRVRAALVRSLVAVANDVGSTLIAEGIETPGDLDALRDLGIDCGQGFLLGRPRDISASGFRAVE